MNPTIRKDSIPAKSTKSFDVSEERHDGLLCFHIYAAPAPKLTFLASAAILTGLITPIATLDYFLIGIGGHLAALITTATAIATAWLCLRSLQSSCHAEIHPWVPLPPATAPARRPAAPTVQPSS